MFCVNFVSSSAPQILATIKLENLIWLENGWLCFLTNSSCVQFKSKNTSVRLHNLLVLFCVKAGGLYQRHMNYAFKFSSLKLIFSFPLPFVDCYNNIDGFLLCFFPITSLFHRFTTSFLVVSLNLLANECCWHHLYPGCSWTLYSRCHHCLLYHHEALLVVPLHG